MSRIFRRPMFRKGGSTNMNGIMSGITDREMHAESNPDGVGYTGFTPSSFEELQPQFLEKLREASSESQSFDPLTKFLLTFGPAFASQRPVGSGFAGAIATAAEASKPAFKDMFEEAAAKKKFEKELAAGATELAIGQAGKEKLLSEEIKAKLAIADKKDEGNELYDLYRNVRIDETGGETPLYVAENFALYMTDYGKKMKENLPSEQIGGLLRYNVNPNDPQAVKEWAKKNKSKINAGKIYYFSEELGIPVVWNNKTQSFDKLSLDFSEVIPGGNDTEAGGTGGEEISVLTYEDGKKEAEARGYTLLPPRPIDAGKNWLNIEKQKYDNPITLTELQDLIEKEKFAETYSKVKQKSRIR